MGDINKKIKNRDYIDTIDNDPELSELFDELEIATSESKEA